jgi:hypothetical protein
VGGRAGACGGAAFFARCVVRKTSAEDLSVIDGARRPCGRTAGRAWWPDARQWPERLSKVRAIGRAGCRRGFGQAADVLALSAGQQAGRGKAAAGCRSPRAFRPPGGPTTTCPTHAPVNNAAPSKQIPFRQAADVLPSSAGQQAGRGKAAAGCRSPRAFRPREGTDHYLPHPCPREQRGTLKADSFQTA